ncbi:MAG: trigger factor [Bacteroidales bacterium]|nr:trigger factor [Bacteroidales bacterium]
MNIVKEETGTLTSQISIEITAADYQESVNKVLKDYRKKAQVPGFRAGFVPMGMVKKMYGDAVKYEEVNKIVSDELSKYIVDNKLEILGQPLPVEDQEKIDIQTQEDFVFKFDIAVNPVIDINLSKRVKVDYYDIQPAAELVAKEVEQTRARFGTQAQPEESAEGDLINGMFNELDAEGNVKEEGVSNKASLSIQFIKDEEIRKQFIGLKVNDVVTYNPIKATENATETASMLGIDKDNESVNSDYQFTLEEIHRTVPAEMNEEFYKQAFPADAITTEEEFTARITEEVKKMYVKESDRLFTRKAVEKIMEKTEVDMPDEFLKRWLVAANEELTEEKVNAEYESFAKGMKWQLLETQLTKDFEINVTADDVKDYYKSMFKNSFMGGGEMPEQDDYLNSIIDNMMKNQEETKRVYDYLFDERLTGIFKEKIGMNNKEVSYEEFTELVTNEMSK